MVSCIKDEEREKREKALLVELKRISQAITKLENDVVELREIPEKVAAELQKPRPYRPPQVRYYSENVPQGKKEIEEFKRNYLTILRADSREFIRSYRETKFSKQEWENILEVNSTVITDLRKPHELTDKAKKFLISGWKRDLNYQPNPKKEKTLINMVFSYGYLTKDNLLDILFFDPFSYLYFDYFLKADKNLQNQAISKVKEGLVKFVKDTKPFSLARIGEYFSDILSTDLKFTKSLIELSYQVRKKSNLGVDENRRSDLIANLKISNKKMRTILFPDGIVRCNQINYENIERLELSKDELLKCSKNVANLYKRLYSKNNKSVDKDVILAIAEHNMTSIEYVPERFKNKKFFKNFFKKNRKKLKEKLLWMHVNNSNELSDGIVSGGHRCEVLVPNSFKDDMDILISALYLFPPCSLFVDEKIYKDKKFMQHYPVAWKKFRYAVEANEISFGSPISVYQKTKNRDYFEFFSNTSNIAFYGTVFRQRITPLHGMPIEFFYDEKFIKEILDFFPEDYFRIPLNLREKFKSYESIALNTYYGKNTNNIRQNLKFRE